MDDDSTVHGVLPKFGSSLDDDSRVHGVLPKFGSSLDDDSTVHGVLPKLGSSLDDDSTLITSKRTQNTAELEIRENKTEFRKPNPGHDTRFTEFHV